MQGHPGSFGMRRVHLLGIMSKRRADTALTRTSRGRGWRGLAFCVHTLSPTPAREGAGGGLRRGPFRCSCPREAFDLPSWERLALTLLAWGTACSPSSSPSSVPHVPTWPPPGHEALSAGLAGQSDHPIPAEPGTVASVGRPNSSRKPVSARSGHPHRRHQPPSGAHIVTSV